MTTTWADGAPDTSLDALIKGRLAVLARLQHLQHELFADDLAGPTGLDGPADPIGIDSEALGHLVRELNELRSALGWLPVDAGGRWCWPE